MASLVDPRSKMQYIDSDKEDGIQARALSELTIKVQQPQPPTASTFSAQSTEA